MKIEKNKSKILFWNQYFNLFIIFLILALLIFTSPLLVRIDYLRCISKLFLDSMGSYKNEYVYVVGGIVGTGLAVSSALWMQSRTSQKEEENKRILEEKIIHAKVKWIEKYLNREMIRLWGVWLWVTFDLSIYMDDLKSVPYDPYCIEDNMILEKFIDIERYLSEESIDTFYEILFFSEKINDYIKSYNYLKMDIVKVSSSLTYNNTIDIHSDVRQSKASYKIIEIIKMIMNEKKDFLFSNNETQVDTIIDSLIKESKMRDQINKLTNKLVEEYTKDGGFEDEFDLFGYNLECQQTVDRWIDISDKTEIPAKYIQSVNNIKGKIVEKNEMRKSYTNIEKRYKTRMEQPPFSTKIRILSEELIDIHHRFI